MSSHGCESFQLYRLKSSLEIINRIKLVFTVYIVQVHVYNYTL